MDRRTRRAYTSTLEVLSIVVDVEVELGGGLVEA
jgi:hypothetical protein